MSKKDLRNIFCLFGVILIGCTSNIIPDPVTKLATKNEIIKGNYIADVDEFTTYEIKKVNHLPEPIDGGYINVRTLDLSNVHLSKTEWNNKKEQLFFSDKTVWPNDLPSDFRPKEIIEQYKSPALNISKIHEQGITGDNVTVAIIDSVLHIEHEEIAGKIISYQKNNVYDRTAFHGVFVSSVFAGENIGVAPDVGIHYFASEPVEFIGDTSHINFDPFVECIDKIIEMNTYLENPIRVISISNGYHKNEDNTQNDFYEAIERAKENGIEVFTTTIAENYDYGLSGVKCDIGKDRNNFENYYEVFEDYLIPMQKNIGVPCGSSTIADMYGKDNYSYSGTTGLSYSVPWLAGMYALCLQVDPALTAEEFFDVAYKTGYAIDENYLTHIIDPERLIQEIRNYYRE